MSLNTDLCAHGVGMCGNILRCLIQMKGRFPYSDIVPYIISQLLTAVEEGKYHHYVKLRVGQFLTLIKLKGAICNIFTAINHKITMSSEIKETC